MSSKIFTKTPEQAGLGAHWEMCWSVGHRKQPLSPGGFQPLGGVELLTWFPDLFPPSSSKCGI